MRISQNSCSSLASFATNEWRTLHAIVLWRPEPPPKPAQELAIEMNGVARLHKPSLDVPLAASFRQNAVNLIEICESSLSKKCCQHHIYIATCNCKLAKCIYATRYLGMLGCLSPNVPKMGFRTSTASTTESSEMKASGGRQSWA